MLENVSNTAIIDKYALQKSEAEVDPNRLLQNDFLKLMTEQLKAQDPMSPTDNGEFLSQMAQFSSASSMSQLQNSFDNFAQTMQSSQALSAANLIDKNALLPADSARVDSDTKKVSGAIELPVSTGNLQITIQDATGKIVKTMNLGSHTAGFASFEWDGTNNDGEQANPGNYEIHAEFGNENGESESALVYVDSRIDSVSLTQGQITLNTADGQTHNLADVQRIG